MLKKYEPALRALAERVADAERQARAIVINAHAREEKYTEVFRTKLEELLHGFSEGGITWQLVTYTTDKQSGQESRIGADLVIAFDIDLDGTIEQKGVLIQAKVNQLCGTGCGLIRELN